MKKTDRITKAITVLLFAAMVIYLGASLIQYTSDNTRTAAAYTTTVEIVGSATGLVVRSEETLESGEENLSVTAADSKRVSKGAVLAVSYQSAVALERATRIREVELEITRVKTLLSAASSAEDLSARDAALKSAVRSLSSVTARHDLGELDNACQMLRSLLFDSDKQSVTQADLDALEMELSSLISIAAEDTVQITAANSGLFTTIIDGYEHLTPDSLNNLTTDSLRKLFDDGREVSSRAFGKLIYSQVWYFAAIMPEGVISTLDSEGKSYVRQGNELKLDFGKYYSSPITAAVESVSEAKNGECVVIFSCSTALAETLTMRTVAVDIVFAEYNGIYVPSEALYTDEEGDCYVFTVTGKQAERKNVTVVYDGGDFVLVTSSGANALHDGNEIIVSARELYDGMMLD